MGNTINLQGFTSPQFNSLKSAFLDIFNQLNETGAAVCVYHRGNKVAHLYANAKQMNSPDWNKNDYVPIMSCSKAFLATCIHILAARKQLDIDAPVSQYWPEFAKNSKETITIKMVLAHTAGLPCHFNGKDGDIFNWQQSIKNIQNAQSIFKPGQEIAYHALTYGHILGELVYRVSGISPSQFFYENIAEPFGIESGLAQRQGIIYRTIRDYPDFTPSKLTFFSKWLPKLPFWQCQFFRPCNKDYHPNSHAWATSSIPAVNGYSTAQGMAKLYAFLANDGQLKNQTLLPKCQVNTLKECIFSGIEKASKTHWRMAAGFMLNSPEFCSFGPNKNNFGHMGMGGSVGFSDPDNKLSFAYVTESFHRPDKHDRSICGKRMQHLIKACYECL
ncbi:MAG: serine hydrolase domain-containing protein [Pseudoalteromonas sp.]|uniref:Beta-lactamase family protein n=1 Tax=Pseudoalteromonas prydzensis TaxID=182141 RepID=A0ABR9FKE4_9GAMM|nr:MULTISPECIES: serine hydrolase domain-containing protein [Pseudoalteromonas]MBE0457262.1 beta-lactamase family protein [Pseudoalteromonas prydzensis]